MSEAVFSKIKSFLDSKELKYEIIVHEPVFTSEQAAKVRGTELKSGAKAMVLRSKGKFFMFVLPADKKLDMKKIEKLLNTDRLSLATPDEVLKITDCKIGGVPPFGNLFSIPLYVDKSLLRNEIINFNAGLHTHSVRMNCKNYISAVSPMIEDFSAESS